MCVPPNPVAHALISANLHLWNDFGSLNLDRYSSNPESNAMCFDAHSLPELGQAKFWANGSRLAGGTDLLRQLLLGWCPSANLLDLVFDENFSYWAAGEQESKNFDRVLRTDWSKSRVRSESVQIPNDFANR